MWIDGDTNNTSIKARLNEWLLWLKQDSHNCSYQKTKDMLAQVDEDPRKAHAKIQQAWQEPQKSGSRGALAMTGPEAIRT